MKKYILLLCLMMAAQGAMAGAGYGYLGDLGCAAWGSEPVSKGGGLVCISRSGDKKKIWCATKTAVTPTKTVNQCKDKGGKSYTYVSQAEAEHERLKSASTSTVSSSLLTEEVKKKYIDWAKPNMSANDVALAIAPTGEYAAGVGNSVYEAKRQALDSCKEYSEGQTCTIIDINLTTISSSSSSTALDEKAEEETARQLAKKKAEEEAAKLAQAELKSKQESTAAVDKSLELEFWQSVKDQNNADMYRAYIDQFPDGVYVALAKIKLKTLGGDTSTVAKASIPNLDYGDYYALVIGNNRYAHLSDLRTAVNDARNVADLLKADYGFDVTLLENADRSQIVKSISGLRGRVGRQDNVLIYYAGHGYLDEAADEGYWLPVDATSDDPSNWVMTDQVVSQIRAMEAKHVMIVADSCFSGAITRGLKIEQRTPAWFEKMVKKKARTALTSGGLEPVMDAGSGGQNSIFAESFLSILRDNDGVLDASQLYSQLRPKVMVNSDQTPEYGDIHRAGHDGGDFLFVRQ